MGARDTEEMLDACRADAVVLEREKARLQQRVEQRDREYHALTEDYSRLYVRTDAAEAKLAAIADLVEKNDPGDRYAPAYVTLAELRAVLGEQPAGVLLTPQETDLVAPALLEAGTRHLEKPGTAWQALGTRLHAIAERLYRTTERQEQHP